MEGKMIEIPKLQPHDVGRKVVYHREHCRREEGELSSWNQKYIFVRFKGPTGEACEPADVSFALHGPSGEQMRQGAFPSGPHDPIF
jgi:hypothetical protein